MYSTACGWRLLVVGLSWAAVESEADGVFGSLGSILSGGAAAAAADCAADPTVALCQPRTLHALENGDPGSGVAVRQSVDCPGFCSAVNARIDTMDTPGHDSLILLLPYTDPSCGCVPQSGHFVGRRRGR